MESKIFVDIDYATRDPRIKIYYKDSEDCRDKLISMITGQSMPGSSDGFCRIERYPNSSATDHGCDGVIVITPVGPVEMIGFITQIRDYAFDNFCIDTSGGRETYKKIIESEYKKLFGVIA